MCHAGQHTVRPIDITILQKPGDQDSRNVAEEFGRKIMRLTESYDRPVSGKEPLTCGLQNSDSPPSDNGTPQETTIQDTGTVGTDGPSSSCPGSSVVAELPINEE
jgi:hypothetical protein